MTSITQAWDQSASEQVRHQRLRELRHRLDGHLLGAVPAVEFHRSLIAHLACWADETSTAEIALVVLRRRLADLECAALVELAGDVHAALHSGAAQ